MRTRTELVADASDRSPFANSTEGSEWIEHWCARCLHDAPFRNMGKGSGCPLLAIAYTDRTPAEWLARPGDEFGRYALSDQYECIEFRPPGGGNAPRPRPEPPDMNGLFERPPRGVRMFAGNADADNVAVRTDA